MGVMYMHHAIGRSPLKYVLFRGFAISIMLQDILKKKRYNIRLPSVILRSKIMQPEYIVPLFCEARGSEKPPEQTYFFAFAQASFNPTVWLNTR